VVYDWTIDFDGMSLAIEVGFRASFLFVCMSGEAQGTGKKMTNNTRRTWAKCAIASMFALGVSEATAQTDKYQVVAGFQANYVLFKLDRYTGQLWPCTVAQIGNPDYYSVLYASKDFS